MQTPAGDSGVPGWPEGPIALLLGWAPWPRHARVSLRVRSEGIRPETAVGSDRQSCEVGPGSGQGLLRGPEPHGNTPRDPCKGNAGRGTAWPTGLLAGLVCDGVSSAQRQGHILGGAGPAGLAPGQLQVFVCARTPPVMASGVSLGCAGVGRTGRGRTDRPLVSTQWKWLWTLSEGAWDPARSPLPESSLPGEEGQGGRCPPQPPAVHSQELRPEVQAVAGTARARVSRARVGGVYAALDPPPVWEMRGPCPAPACSSSGRSQDTPLHRWGPSGTRRSGSACMRRRTSPTPRHWRSRTSHPTRTTGERKRGAPAGPLSATTRPVTGCE